MVPIGTEYYNVKRKLKRHFYVSGPMVNNYLKKIIKSITIFSNKLWYLTNDKVKKVKISFIS